jgi:Flp pilus assembly protein protease CpaA
MSDLEAYRTKFNRIVTLAIVAFSVVAGGLIGFLMIYLRKRDIMLTRADGNSLSKKYLVWVLEQFICIILGITAGGACYLWNPIDKLLIFAVVYFVAFSVVTLLFLVIQRQKDQKILIINH